MGIPFNPPADFSKLACAQCRHGEALGFDFSMALQPIVDTVRGKTFAYEALARGIGDKPASEVFRLVNESNRYRFDQTARVKAIELAARLEVKTSLSINFMPNAVYRPELCIRTTLAAAELYAFPTEQIVFEFTENELVVDTGHLQDIVAHYQSLGFRTALDDFGAGHAGLNLLADLKTDLIKLDMALIRNIDTCRRRQAIVRCVTGICQELGITVIAEGVETQSEWKALLDQGIELFQGYFFARPAYEALPPISPLFVS